MERRKKRSKLFWAILVFVLIVNQVGAQVNILHLEQLTYRDGLPQNSAQAIKQDKYGFIWVSSFAGLCRYDGYQFVEYLPEPENPKSIFTKSVYNLMLDSAQQLWVAFFDTVRFCKYNYETNDFIRYSNTETPVYIKEMANRKLLVTNVAENNRESWALDNGQLVKLNKKTGQTETYFLNFPEGTNVSDIHTKIMFLDSFGTLWIGTENQGIFKVNTHTKPFYTFFYKENGKEKIINNIVRAIEEDDDGRLWIGTMYEGVMILDPQSQTIEYLKTSNAGRQPDMLQGGQVRCMHCDKIGHIWIGTKNGLSEYFPESGRIRNYNRFGKVNIPHNWVHAVVEDNDGNLWIGTFNGIARYDRENDRFIAIDPLKTLANNKVFCMTVDHNNNLWVGTHGGGATCLKRTAQTDEFESINYLNEEGNPNSISSNRIFCLFEDSNGYIWAATDYGLNKIDPKTSAIKRYTFKDGLSDDIVVSITEDNSGNIWMATKKGLSKMDPKTGKISHYNEKDGLQNNEMSENCCFKNRRTGELVFGTLNGLVSFNPGEITDSDILPKVVLTRLEVLNQEVVPGQAINKRVILDKQISLADKVTLDYSHKSFSIEFAALQFANPMANKYKFKLDGYDDNWIETSAARRIATYSNLPAGKYTFRVMASNDDGVWNPKERKLAIVIRPPWWFSVWAFIGYIVIISSISYFTVAYFIGRLQMKNEIRYQQMKAKEITEMNQMKVQFFTNVSHELRTPLSLLLDPLRKLNSGQVEPSKLGYYYSLMYQNAQRLSRLVNELLDFRKIESKSFSFHPSPNNLASFLENIANAFKLNATDRGIHFSYTSNHPVIEASFDENIIEKIVFNLLSNAFKYNKKNGSVDFRVTLSETKNENGCYPVEIVVADTGIGIATESIEKVFDLYYQDKITDGVAREGSGIGLSLTHELVVLHGGEIKVESTLDEGTVFMVKLPIGIGFSDVKTEETSAHGAVGKETLITLVEQDDIATVDPEDGERFKLLVVEDDPDVRTYICNVIGGSAYELSEAENGADGWEQSLATMPDLVITDLMMPEMDGFELCKKLKSDKRTSHIPVIVLTALSSERTTLSAYDAGADAYITKPFSSAILIARIRNLISNRKSLTENLGKVPFIDVKKIANNALDEVLLNKAIECIEEFISEPEFNIDWLADKLSLSRRHLSHKVKTLTGQTVNEFVKTVRLNKAAELLLTTDNSVSEIAYQLGYTAPANFSRSFSKQFGKTPTEFVASYTEEKETEG